MSDMSDFPALDGEFKGRHLLFIFVAFFGVVIAVNIWMAYLAIHTSTGLVVDDSYVASQSFDKDTAKLAADAAMDIHPKLSFANGTLDVAVVTAAGAPVALNDVKLTLGRAVSATTDVSPVLEKTGDGHYAAKANLGAGQWQGKITGTLPNGHVWSRPVLLKVAAP